MSTSDSESDYWDDEDPVWDAWANFENMYRDREEVFGSVKLNKAQKEQFNSLFPKVAPGKPRHFFSRRTMAARIIRRISTRQAPHQ